MSYEIVPAFIYKTKKIVSLEVYHFLLPDILFKGIKN